MWLVDPIAKMLEVHTLDDDHRWRDVRIYEGDVRVRAEPFAAIEIDLSALCSLTSVLQQAGSDHELPRELGRVRRSRR
jgi:hypothetical protein